MREKYVSGGKILDAANKVALKTLNMQYPETKTQKWIMTSVAISFRNPVISKERCFFVGNVSTFCRVFADIYIRVKEKVDNMDRESAEVRIRMKKNKKNKGD